VATPVVNLDGASKVGRNIARSMATAAAGPVHLIDLPETSVDAAVAVLVAGVGIAARLVLDDALAAGLAPAVLRAPAADIDMRSTTADAAVVVSAVGSHSNGNQSKNCNNKKLVHLC